MSRTFSHDVVDSTNERALESIARGEASDGDLHVATQQTMGRGRRGHTWVSAPGEGSYATIVVRPVPPAPEPAGWTIATGLAVRDGVRGLGLQRARLKWPNDVLVGNAKLAGILVEARGFDPQQPALVVGVGINVLQRNFPAELTAEREVTSLALEGVRTTCDEVLSAWVAAFALRRSQLVEAPASLTEAYLEATGLGGAPVRVRCGREVHEGVLEALDLQAGLRLTQAGGTQLLALAHVTAVEAL